MNKNQVQNEAKTSVDFSNTHVIVNALKNEYIAHNIEPSTQDNVPEYVLMAGDSEGNMWQPMYDDAEDEAMWGAECDDQWVEAILYRIPIHKVVEDWQSVSYDRNLLRDEDDDLSEYEVDSYEGYVRAKEPPCRLNEYEPENPAGHNWTATYDREGGLKENPGVVGNGGGVIIHEHCTRCNCTRTTDTWATNPIDGTQGHTVVEYGIRGGNF